MLSRSKCLSHQTFGRCSPCRRSGREEENACSNMPETGCPAQPGRMLNSNGRCVLCEASTYNRWEYKNGRQGELEEKKERWFTKISSCYSSSKVHSKLKVTSIDSIPAQGAHMF